MQTISSFLFCFISLFIFVSIYFVIFAKKTLYSVFSAIGFFIGIGLLYFMLNAPFNGVIQIAIYATGVSLMLMFTLALVNEYLEGGKQLVFKPYYLIGLVGVGLLSSSAWLLLREDFSEYLLNKDYLMNSNIAEISNTVEKIGYGIFQKYVLSFELFSILLLAVLIGVGIIFVKRERGEK